MCTKDHLWHKTVSQCNSKRYTHVPVCRSREDGSALYFFQTTMILITLFIRYINTKLLSFYFNNNDLC